MKASHYRLWYRKRTHHQALVRNHGLSLRPIGLVLLILTLACASCGPSGSTNQGPEPPAQASGQAVLGWGGNSSGQLGDGSTFQRLIPSSVVLKDVRSIAAGGSFSVAVTADGRVLEWGGGMTTPTEVAGLTSIKQVAAGDRHRLALKDDGTVWAWGENDRGQLGDGTHSTRSTPVQVVGLSNVLGIAAGRLHNLAIGSGFSLWSWGANSEGQLGDGTKTDRLMPVAVPGITAIEVAASGTHSVVLTTDVKVKGWGSNNECQLGVDPRSSVSDPITCSDHMQPTILPVPQGHSPRTTGHAVAATDAMTLVVLSSGDVYGFGGQGDPTSGQFRGMCNPDLVLGGAYIFGLPATDQVVAGTKHALFRTAAGEVWNLGSNLAGQGGLGTTSIQECPHAVPSAQVRGVTALAAGEEHSLALIEGFLNMAPAVLNFGGQPVGTSSTAPLEIKIANDGLAPVAFYDIGISGFGDFSFTDDCPDRPAVLAAGANCTIKVTFAPTAAGQRDGRIRFTHDGRGRRQEVVLGGIGTEAKVVFSPAVVDFGVQRVGTTSVAQTVTVRNDGSAPLLINNIAATAGFSISGDTCPRAPTSLAIQATCSVNVAFVPNISGDAVGELRVTYEPSKVTSMQLKGTGN